MSLVPFSCPTHGYLLDTFPSASVWCGKCGHAALPPLVVRQAQKRKRDKERRRIAAGQRGGETSDVRTQG